VRDWIMPDGISRNTLLENCVGVTVWLHVFLISIVDTRNESSSRPSHFISGEASSTSVARRVCGQQNPC
jgi:hypothetical protein